ncbi:MAG TPA: LacI family DNA-binding transcriptional regulator [Steroidobacteraceae bacterium]|jgi:LacI family transcriptional regulator|nr:LacI family DNA-binding transcriptional regulator [Steroidobacteraceae bacterium]
MARKTIDDVAKAAGVAIKTVSRVLNDEPNVRDETRARVQAVVKALNYHPSLSARSLAGRRSYLVGLVYGNPSANYVVEVQHGAMTRCRQQGFQLFAHQCSTRGDDLPDEVLGLVDQTHLDGLVITPPLSESAELIKALDRRSVPFVRIAPNDLRHPSPYSDMDDEGAAREMTDYLIGLGHRRIGFIIGHPEHSASARRLQGYKAALRAHRVPYRAEFVKQGHFVFDSGMESGRQLLMLPERPTAIFASNDDMAAGVVMAAHEMGIAVPAELSITGFDDTHIARTIWPRLTTVHQPTYDLAYAATGLLLQMLKTRKAPAPVRLAHQLVCRESAGPAPVT